MHRHPERGSALLVIIVVLLVLSAVGTAMILLMEEERDTTYDETYASEALYAAEVGLRLGEGALRNATSAAIDGLLAHTSIVASPVLTPAVPVFPENLQQYDLGRLGTYLAPGGVELANQSVALAAPSAQGAAPHELLFSLYLRNNTNDISVADNNPGTSARDDNDLTVNLVSVGWVRFGDTVHAVKILEEEYSWVDPSQDPSAQKLSDSGGTSSVGVGF